MRPAYMYIVYSHNNKVKTLRFPVYIYESLYIHGYMRGRLLQQAREAKKSNPTHYTQPY